MEESRFTGWVKQDMAKGIRRGVTVILPVYNQERTVEECLNSLQEQTYANMEIWVGNDGSTDDTKEIVSKYPVKLFEFKHKGRPKTLNRLLHLVKTKFVAVVEGDAIYKPNYLEACISHFSSREVGGVIARQLAVASDSIVSRAISAYRDVRWKLVDSSRYIQSTAWVFRKKALDDVGGFDEDLTIADDVALGISLIRRGWKIEFVPETTWHHHEPTSLITLMRQQFRWGVGSYIFLKKYGGEISNPHVKMRWKTLILFNSFVLLFVISLFLFRTGLILLLTSVLLYLFFKTILFYSRSRKVTEDTAGAILFPSIDMLGKIAFSTGFLYGYLGISSLEE